MNCLNSILVEGNLARDPDVKVLPSGNSVCDFTLATDRSFKVGQDAYEKEVSYFDVEAWSKLGSACAQNLQKGRGVRVVGRLKQDRWTDVDGRARTRVKIVAEHVEFKPQKPAAGAGAGTAGGGLAAAAAGAQGREEAREADAEPDPDRPVVF